LAKKLLTVASASGMETHLCRWSLDRMNVAAVFAPKKLYGYASCGSFAGVLKLKFAATSRTRLVTDVFGFHWRSQGCADVRSLSQSVQSRNAVCTGFVSQTQNVGGQWQVKGCASM